MEKCDEDIMYMYIYLYINITVYIAPGVLLMRDLDSDIYLVNYGFFYKLIYVFWLVGLKKTTYI